MIPLITSVLLAAGSLLILIASAGLLRLPDVLCRSHAVAKAMTLGIFLMLFGLLLHLDGEEVSLKILLVICFQVVTIPIAGHLVGLLAMKKQVPLWQPPRSGAPESSRSSSPR